MQSLRLETERRRYRTGVLKRPQAEVHPQKIDGFVKRPSSRRARRVECRCTYVRRSDNALKRNAEIGLFTKPSRLSQFDFPERYPKRLGRGLEVFLQAARGPVRLLDHYRLVGHHVNLDSTGIEQL